MFKFNFSQSDDNNDNADDSNTKSDLIACKECLEIIPTAEQIDKYEKVECEYLNEMQFDDDLRVYFFPIDDLIHEITAESEDINYSEQNNSDIVPGVYEGGAKVWECTQDLGIVLSNSTDDKKSIISEFAGKTVLDLGCGAGVLGILALYAGANVHFQDYNETVLRHITIPNAIANASNLTEKLINITKYYSGDWQNYITETASGPKFDFILTSETIFNPNNYEKLLNVFKSKLKLDGVIYVAAKSIYFGVGGSVSQFIETTKKDGTFSSNIIYSFKDNVHRDVIELKFKAKVLNEKNKAIN